MHPVSAAPAQVDYRDFPVFVAPPPHDSLRCSQNPGPHHADPARVPRGKMRLTADIVQPRSGGRSGGGGVRLIGWRCRGGASARQALIVCGITRPLTPRVILDYKCTFRRLHRSHDPLLIGVTGVRCRLPHNHRPPHRRGPRLPQP